MALLFPQSQSQAQQMQSSEEEIESKKREPTVTVSNHLHLISSHSHSLDKQAILKRLRHHKSLNKFRNVFQSLVNNSSSAGQQNERWSDPQDAFSSP